MKRMFTKSVLAIFFILITPAVFSQPAIENPSEQAVQPAIEITEAASGTLCVPQYVTGCALGDGLTDFAVEEIENYGSGCANLNGTGWSQYLELGPATLYQGQMHDFIMASGFTGNFTTIWIDFNDDYLLTEEEIVLDNYWIQLANQQYTVQVEIPADALPGTHYMRVRTRFANFCDDPCASYFYGEAEDYRVTIEAPPSTAIFEDDFEAYTLGQQLACQNPDDWTTWSNQPCSSEDAYISDDFAYSGVQSVHLVNGNDQVKNLETYLTSGVYDVSLMIYIPSGADAYYNVMSDFNGEYEWGFEVYFNLDGSGSVNGGETGAETFIYPADTWMHSKLIVDLDNDMAYYLIDEVLIHKWQWTLGAAGGGSLLQLAAVDFYGPNETTSFYFDDFIIDDGVAPPTLPAPANLTGPDYVITGDDINLVWDAPITDLLMQWDNGINNDYIGLTNGGTFAVASHWEPENLAPFAGMVLHKVVFFAGDYAGPTFTIKVWTGENATEVLSQPLAGFIQNDWNEIVLDTPILIDASMDLWFGYETTHVQGDYPAGVDAGPAIQGLGDMIYLDGEWSSLLILTGGSIDANWNLIGVASLADGTQKAMAAPPIAKTSQFTSNSSVLSSLGYGSGKKYIAKQAKELLGYNVYRDGAQLGYTTQTNYTDSSPEIATFEYFVTALYNLGESDPSNSWFVDNFYITGLNKYHTVDVQVFPNPANGFVNIGYDQKINKINIFDQMGQLLLEQEVGSHQTRVALSNYRPGVYFISIVTEKETLTKRFIIK